MSKTVRVSLTGGNAVSIMQRELDLFKKKIKRQTEEFVKALAERGVEIAQLKFSTAVYAGTNDVSVKVEDERKNKKAVVAMGNAVLFIEFGTGILYPDDHPEKVDGVVPRGTHGQGKGANPNGWSYYGDPGNEPTSRVVHYASDGRAVVRTRGNQANKCLYETREELRRDWESIARRVFK